MAHSSARLMLYAVISAIESDLRFIITLHIATSRDSRQLLGDDLFIRTLDRFETEHGEVSSAPSAADLLPYTDFADLVHIANRYRTELPISLAASIKDNASNLEKLVATRNRVMHTRPLAGDDIACTLDCAHSLSNISGCPWNSLRETLSKLESDPSFVLGLSLPVVPDSNSRVSHNLPVPDFDETGLIGRDTEVSRVVQACLGPYPVVTVLGEGGVGKTAVALKAAFEILDNPRSNFDAVIWASSKTTAITGTEIRQIENAISDALGLFSEVSRQLGGSANADPFTETLAYLREFRVMLVLDNLETVLDESVRQFLSNLPAGSKILITSRVGVGAYDYPIKMEEMKTTDAVGLLRSLAAVRQVSFLAKCENSKLAKFCEGLHNNPGFIKWFVAGVQSGRRPEDLLANRDVFLDYCLSNIYEFMSVESRDLLDIFQAVSVPLSQPELVYLSDIDGDTLQRALAQLLSSTVVKMTARHVGASFITTYEVSELPRAYLNKHHPVEREKHKRLLKARAAITAYYEAMYANAQSSPYQPESVVLRSTEDAVVGKYLVDALRESRKFHTERALELVQKAHEMAPTFSEVYRVEAFIHAMADNAVAARDAYLTAIELSPKSAPLKYFYGGFLLRHLSDAEAALQMFKEANALDKDAVPVLVEMSRALLYTSHFEEARRTLCDIINNRNPDERARRKAEDLRLQCYLREAETLYANRELDAVTGVLESMSGVFMNIPIRYRDGMMREKAMKASTRVQLTKTMVEKIGLDHSIVERLSKLADDFQSLSGDKSPARQSVVVEGQSVVGVVQTICGANFGFITAETGDELFFHRGSLRDYQDWPNLISGVKVQLSVGRNAEGLCAVDVERILSSTGGQVGELELGSNLSGVVSELRKEAGFGFITAKTGSVFFFHRSMVSSFETWASIAVGTSVKFVVGINPKDNRICAVEVTKK